MNRYQGILVAVLVVELASGAVLFYHRWSRATPPRAELSYVDPLAAEHIRDLVQTCRLPDDWAHLGAVYLAYGYFQESEACYRVAVQAAPLHAEHTFHWAFALERIGRNAEANRVYERAIALGHPQPGDCWYYIGRNHLRLENADEARQAFQQAADQPSARYEFARLLVRAGHSREAVPLLEQLAAQYPKAVQPYLLRCRIEALQGGFLEGVYADRAALAPDVLPSPWYPQFARQEEVHDQLGVAGEWRACKELLEQGRFTEAEPRLRNALRLQWDPAGVDLLAKVAARNNQLEEAIRLLQEVIDRAGPSVHFLTRLGDMVEQAGRIDQAAQAWFRAIQFGLPPGAKFRDYQDRKMAAYFERKGDKSASRRHLARAYYIAGHEAFWNEKLPDAQLALEQAVAFDPGLAHAWFYLGEARRLTGQAVSARDAYQRCLAIDPDHGRARASLALVDRPER
jgi:tetratricopeptide (TPR) repeat protein